MESCVTTFVTLNQVPTKISVFDSKIKSACDLPRTHEGQLFFDYERVIVMISGNPGEIDFYYHYLLAIHQATRIPVIGVSNSGHNRMPFGVSMPNVAENPNLYSLEAQIVNKAHFITNYISKKASLILLAHSIGCYGVLELLHQYDDIKRRVDHSVLIFPTIDSMLDTDSGQSVHRLFTTFFYPLIGLAYILDNLLPQFAKEWLAVLNLKSASDSRTAEEPIPHIVKKSATNLFNPDSLKAVIYMTECELAQVKSPNMAAIKANSSRLSILYGTADHWCPPSFYNRIVSQLEQQNVRDVDIRCCLGTIDHAFVIDTQATQEIANLTLKIIESKWQLR